MSKPNRLCSAAKRQGFWLSSSVLVGDPDLDDERRPVAAVVLATSIKPGIDGSYRIEELTAG